MFHVDKGLPIPHAATRQRYPWKEMDIGDSFFVADGNQKSIACAAYQATARLGWRFITRTVDGGIRVWRTQ